jgi:hypothetical protein
MRLKNPDIILGKIISENSFVSGTKFWKLESVSLDDDFFTKGTKVLFTDPDDNSEYIGFVEWLMIDEFGNVEVSLSDNVGLGRVDLESLEIIQ